jgi:hypothetical protein
MANLCPQGVQVEKESWMAGETIQISKRHSFRPISTRKYYAGTHYLGIQVNGIVHSKVSFDLK